LGSFAELGGFRPQGADELRGLEMGDEMRSLLDEFLADEERARAGIRLEGNQVIAAKISAYPSVEGLLYDLYTSYLREIYEPFTYGKDWVLAKPHAMVTLLALPWQWLQHKRARRLMDVIPQYRTQVTPPGTICLHSESVWAVVDQGFEQACGLFTSSDQVAAEVSASPKYALSIMIDCHRAGRVFERGRIVSGVFPLDSLLPAEYRHKFVVVPSRSYLGDEQCQDAVYVI